MIREGILIAVALLYSAAVVALGRRLARPASVAAYVTALATLVTVLLLSMSTARWVDDLLSSHWCWATPLLSGLDDPAVRPLPDDHSGDPPVGDVRHWWAVGGAGVLMVCFVGLWLRVKTLDLPDMAAVFYGRQRGDPPAVLWMHIVMGGGVMYIAAWGIRRSSRFSAARGARMSKASRAWWSCCIPSRVSAVCAPSSRRSETRRGVDMAVVHEVKPFLKIFLSAGAMASSSAKSGSGPSGVIAASCSRAMSSRSWCNCGMTCSI